MRPKKILLKTTIQYVEDDWHIGRFSMLGEALEQFGHRVEAHDWHNGSGADEDLAKLPDSDFDQLWLFAVDVTDALTQEDAEAIQRFRRRGGGVLATRDHEDLGASLTGLGVIGQAHHFHSTNLESDASRHQVDDQATGSISWPNYHTGANGDYQRVRLPDLSHELVLRKDGSPLEFLPAHPHEGVVSVPPGAAAFATELIRGLSRVTGNEFCVAVAFSGETDAIGNTLGRAVAQSTFHHFADANLDPAAPLPTFCTERSGTSMRDNPRALEDSLRYIENLANWL
ncbi:MAG: hypothetical protein AAF290_17220 [Pseudomonadota bacterium]